MTDQTASHALYKPSSRISKYLHHSVFEEINELCSKTKSINMGQGAPDWDPPKFVKNSLVEVAHEKEDQYTRVGGHPELVKIIAEEYSEKFSRNIDPMKEVVITNGAEGAINNFLFAFLEEGDEVVVFEPGFPAFLTMIEIYGGKPRFSTLEPPKEDSQQWTIDFESLESLFNSKTKAIIINTPHNPTGKVFQQAEYDKLIQILKKWPQVLIFADEVYEHVIYDKNQHLRIGSFENMWERTVSVYSGGKIFSVTGWRIGWAVGPEYLIHPMTIAQSWTAYGANRPAQAAIAEAMKTANLEGSGKGELNFYETVQKVFQEKKETLTEIMKNGPFECRILDPEGGFFLAVDISKSASKIPIKYFYKEGKSEDENPVQNTDKLESPDHTVDYAFVRWLLYDYGIACIPFFPFYNQSKQDATTFIRFTICKNEKTLQRFADRLHQKKK